MKRTTKLTMTAILAAVVIHAMLPGLLATNEAYDLGHSALDRRNYREAVEAFDEVIDDGGDQVDAAMALADASRARCIV